MPKPVKQSEPLREVPLVGKKGLLKQDKGEKDLLLL